MKARVLAIFGIQAVLGLALGAQEPGAPPAFEVASVKPNKSGDGRINIGILPGGRFTANNVALALLIRQAYQIQPSQIIGGPGWMESDHFDIIAKAPENSAPQQMPMMMRALLADRFKLKTHNETRELPIYALVKARNDGKLGPQLNAAAIDCAAMAAARGRGAPPPGTPFGPGGPVRRGGPGAGGAPPPPGSPDGLPVAPGSRPPCAQMMGPASISGGGMTMEQLANVLSMRVNRIVVDRTGLTGGFDIDLAWTPDQMPQGPPGVPPPGAPPLPAIDPNGPSLFTAVQEQLGLKLESTKGSANVLVIDSVEHPTED